MSIFEVIFGESPKKFRTVEEVDAYVVSKIGHQLSVTCPAPMVVLKRGNILPLKKTLDPSKAIDKALAG